MTELDLAALQGSTDSSENGPPTSMECSVPLQTCECCQRPLPLSMFISGIQGCLGCRDGLERYSVKLKRVRNGGLLTPPEPRKRRIRTKPRQKLTPAQRRTRINEYCRNKRRTDPQFKIASNTRCRINQAIRTARNGYKSTHTLELLGCSAEFYVSYLESLFLPGMSWGNYGRETGKLCWEIDHIRPCASFDLTDPAQQQQCFHYLNTQPMWALDSHIKNDTF